MEISEWGGVLHVIHVQQSVKRESHIHCDHWLLTLPFGQSRIVVHILIAGMIFFNQHNAIHLDWHKAVCILEGTVLAGCGSA